MILQSSRHCYSLGAVCILLGEDALTPPRLQEIQRLHSALNGVTQAEGEQSFLLLASRQDMYGCGLFEVETSDGTKVHIGIGHDGVCLCFPNQTLHFPLQNV